MLLTRERLGELIKYLNLCSAGAALVVCGQILLFHILLHRHFRLLLNVSWLHGKQNSLPALNAPEIKIFEFRSNYFVSVWLWPFTCHSHSTRKESFSRAALVQDDPNVCICGFFFHWKKFSVRRQTYFVEKFAHRKWKHNIFFEKIAKKKHWKKFVVVRRRISSWWRKDLKVRYLNLDGERGRLRRLSKNLLLWKLFQWRWKILLATRNIFDQAT